MSKFYFLLLPLLGASFATAREHPGNWIEVHSSRFTIVTNSNEKQGRHIAAHFIEPILMHHDKAQAEVFCYADVAAPDARTARFWSMADHWPLSTTAQICASGTRQRTPN